jgi:LysM repeat protein
MNHTKTIIQTILLLFVSNIIMAQSPIYLEVGDCTKEMHYTHTNSSNYFGEYYDYHFALNDYETVTLEVSKNSLTNLTFSELSRQKITTCGSYNFGQQFKYETINTLQNGQQEVYIVKQTANGYSVGKVTNVTYQFFLEDDDFLRVIGKEVSFDFDGKRMYDAGEELIQEGEGSFVFYTEQYERCYKKPIFMHVPTNFMEAVTLEYALGVGLVRTYSDDMEKKLIAVNGQNINHYLDVFCGIKEPLFVENTIEEPIEMEKEAVSNYDDNSFIDTEAAAYFIDDNTYSTKGVEEVLPADLAIITMLPELAEAENKAVSETNTTEIFNVDVEYKPELFLINHGQNTTKGVSDRFQKHVVNQGETLYGLSKKYNLTTLQLKRLNSLESNTIEIGQVLLIK